MDLDLRRTSGRKDEIANALGGMQHGRQKRLRSPIAGAGNI